MIFRGCGGEDGGEAGEDVGEVPTADCDKSFVLLQDQVRRHAQNENRCQMCQIGALCVR